jgi:hypothetical protein
MTPAFYLGLLLVVTGTGMLKPNMSTLVGELSGASGQPACPVAQVARLETPRLGGDR